MIHGVDVSAYQPDFDFASARREGFDFAIVKATEGSTWRSPNYRDQMARARAAGMIVAAYHYVRGEDVRGQLANIERMVEPGTPVVLDVETGAGDPASVKRLLDAVRAARFPSNLIYVPHWYWTSHWGRPDLRSWGLAGNWHSEYPDKVVRRLDGFRNWIATRFDRTVGGLPTVVMQFAETLAVANYPNGRIDGNAFRGSREELAALLEGDDMPSAKEVAEEVVRLLESKRYPTVRDDGTIPPDTEPDRSVVNMLVEGTRKDKWSEQRTVRTEEAVGRVEVKLDAIQGSLTEGEIRVLAAVRAVDTGSLVADEVVDGVAEILPDSLVEALARLGRRTPGPSAEVGEPVADERGPESVTEAP